MLSFHVHAQYVAIIHPLKNNPDTDSHFSVLFICKLSSQCAGITSVSEGAAARHSSLGRNTS